MEIVFFKDLKIIKENYYIFSQFRIFGFKS